MCSEACGAVREITTETLRNIAWAQLSQMVPRDFPDPDDDSSVSALDGIYPGMYFIPFHGLPLDNLTDW